MWFFSSYGDFNCARQGKIDGTLGIPPWNSEDQPDFIRELFATAQTTLDGIERKWHKLDERLKTLWSRAVLLKQKLQDELERALIAEEQAQQQYQETHGKRIAVPELRRQRFWYAIVVGVVLICEFPLNALVFQQLGASYVETMLMTAAVAITLVACAHFLGEQLHERIEGRVLVIVWRILLSALPFLVIWGVARMREIHLRRVGLADLGNQELLLINMVVNLLIFTALAYFSHRIHEPALEDVLHAANRRLRLERQLHRGQQQENRMRIGREKTRDRARCEAAAIKNEVRRRAARYRREHLRHRKDRDRLDNSATPIWFQEQYEPKLQTPDLDKQTDWSVSQGNTRSALPEHVSRAEAAPVEKREIEIEVVR